jgi:hypothetical protein
MTLMPGSALISSFQFETLAEPKPWSRKRTYAYLFPACARSCFFSLPEPGV